MTTLQKEQLGTGHAVAQVVPILHDYRGTLIITCGDTPLLTTKTLYNLIKFHQENDSDLTVMTTEFDNPFGYGRIVRDDNGQVKKIIEQKGNIVVTDVRIKHEYETFKKAGAITVRVEANRDIRES